MRGRGSAGADRSSGFRPEIEGLRAVAVLVVVLYHAGVPVVSGGYVGVDVFFVVSGFLMTRLLIDETRRTGRVSVRQFYLRRARRLLPAAATTLLGVAVLAWLFLGAEERRQVGGDLLAAAGYLLNWRYVDQTVDYLGGGWQASPVQHFWSLAVEEQFYLVWPVLFVLVAWCARRAAGRLPLRLVAGSLVLVVGVASLGYAVSLTARQADVAYFSTLARCWELALGGGVAVLAPRIRRSIGVPLAWVGLAAIAASAVCFDDDTLFPGLTALVPTGGAALLLLAGTDAAPQLLTVRPMRYVGRISYSWYLWHWPAVVFAASVWPNLTTVQGLAAAALAGLLSAASYRWVEQPFRRSAVFTGSPPRTLGLVSVSTATVAAVGLLLPLTVTSLPVKQMSEVSGAEALRSGDPVQEKAAALRPNPQVAKDDRPRNYADGCHAERLATVSAECVYGDASSDTTVVLFGDSHAMQYFPAFQRLAKKRGWRLVALTKSGCPPADVTVYNRPLKRGYHECNAWTANAVDRIVDEERPDLVVASGRSTYPVVEDGEKLAGKASAKKLRRGYVDTLKKLTDAGLRVRVIDDNPHPDKDIPRCVSKKLDRLRECAFTRGDAGGKKDVSRRAVADVDQVEAIDPTDVLCRKGTCPAVAGDVIVYGQTTHLTATYVKTMTPWFGARLPAD